MPLSKKQLARIHIIKNGYGITDIEYRNLLIQICQITSSKEMNPGDYTKFISALIAEGNHKLFDYLFEPNGYDYNLGCVDRIILDVQAIIKSYGGITRIRDLKAYCAKILRSNSIKGRIKNQNDANVFISYIIKWKKQAKKRNARRSA